MIYSPGSKKAYHRGLGHVEERLGGQSGKESILKGTEKWKLNILDCKKLSFFFIHIAAELKNLNVTASKPFSDHILFQMSMF